MKPQTALAALALVCLSSTAAEPPRVNVFSTTGQGANCPYEGETFEPGARVCRGGQHWECQPNGEWVNLGTKCNRKP